MEHGDWQANQELKMYPKKSKKIEIELPEEPPSGGYAACPSGDNDYDDAMKEWQKNVNAVILAAIPRGYNLKSCETKKVQIVRHYATIVVEEQ